MLLFQLSGLVSLFLLVTGQNVYDRFEIRDALEEIDYLEARDALWNAEQLAIRDALDDAEEAYLAARDLHFSEDMGDHTHLGQKGSLMHNQDPQPIAGRDAAWTCEVNHWSGGPHFGCWNSATGELCLTRDNCNKASTPRGTPCTCQTLKEPKRPRIGRLADPAL